MKQNLTAEQLVKIAEPLPPEAISAHPTRTGMSTIKGIFVTERLNEVFGVGEWIVKTKLLAPISVIVKTTSSGRERTEYTALSKTILEIPSAGIYYECIASSTNDDMGDAAKGATTDAITKIASWIGIGIDVYKGKHGAPVIPPKPYQAPPRNDVAPPTKTRTTAPVIIPAGLQKIHQEYILERAVKATDQERNDPRFAPTEDWTEERYRKGIEYFKNR
jgi:hypothetical protein